MAVGIRGPVPGEDPSMLARLPIPIAEPELTVWQLVDIAWMYTFQNYFRLKKIEDERTRKKEAAEAEEQATGAGGEEADAL